MQDLQEKGFKPLDAVNLLKKERVENSSSYRYRNLPIFRVTFHKDDNIDEIFKITNILKIKVKIEAVRPQTKLIPQCKRCQGFNHTKSYCQREARCVKCAGKHDTENCEMPKSIVPKCINCKGNHPASYRGCEVAKELQKLRNKSRSVKDIHTNKHNVEPLVSNNGANQQVLQNPIQLQIQTSNQQTLQQSVQATSRQISQTKSYSGVLDAKNLNASYEETPTILGVILKNMEKINQRLDFQAKLSEKLIDKLNAIVVNSINSNPQ